MEDVLAAWGALAVVGTLGGGHRNEVLEVRRDGQRLVARRSRRSAARDTLGPPWDRGAPVDVPVHATGPIEAVVLARGSQRLYRARTRTPVLSEFVG
jgi:hypothetical protein